MTRGIVTELRAAGAAIPLTSHDPTDVERLADRIAVLAGGRLVAMGTPAALTAGTRPRLRVRLDVAADLGRHRRSAGGTTRRTASVRVVAEADDARYAIEGVAPDPDLVAALAAWCASVGRLIVEARTSGGSLEEAYLELVGAGREGSA